MPITKLPNEATPRSKQDLLYSTLLALGGGGSGITRLPQTEVPRSEQDLLYSIMLAAQGISSGGGMVASTQAEAEAGEDNETAMTPLRVAQKIAFDFGAPTTIGKALLNLANPGAITFLRMNADNTASALSASDMRTALGLGTIATQAASAVAITGGTIAGVTSFESSATNFNVDTYGNLLAKYFKLNNSGLNQTSLSLAVVSGAVPSTPSSFTEVLRLTGGALYLSPAGAGTVVGGSLYLGSVSTVLVGGTNTVALGSASSSPSAQCFKGPNGSGTNIVGGKLSIAPGQSTGNATPGKLALQGTASGSSGSTAQTLVDVLTIASASYITLGNATVAAALTLGIAASGGLIIGQTNSTALGFWGASPVNQWNTEGTGGIASAGSGTPVLDDSKFTGGAGSLAYTINDIVAALKACGIMAA